MIYLWIILLVIPSPILIFISCEAIAILMALKGYSAPGIALALATGQTIGFTFICVFGEQLCERWERIRKLRAKADLDRYRKHTPKLIGWAAFIGIPPVNLSCLGAAAVKYPALPLVPILFSCRFARYLIVAGLPHLFSDYIDLNQLPAWLRDI